MPREKYRAEMSHSIEGKKVNRNSTFRRPSEEAAKKHFRALLEADRTIQEAGLFRERDDRLIDEHIGYC